MPPLFEHIDTFYVLEKGDKNISQPISQALSEQVQKRTSTYVSHCTQGFDVSNEHYQVSEFKFRRGGRGAPPWGDENWQAACFKAGVDKFGSGPNFEEKVPMLVYAVIDYRLLSDMYQKASKKNGTIGGDCVFEVNDSRHLFSGSTYPMTHDLWGLQLQRNMKQLNNRRLRYRMKLEANFIKPASFSQSDNHKIILPGTNVADVLSLGLKFLRTIFGPSKSDVFTVHKVTVALKELTCAPRWQGDRILLYNSSKYLREEELLNVNVKEKIHFDRIKERPCVYWLPRKLYDCQIPPIGPTFFSNTLTRSYALEIAVYFKRDGKPKPIVCSTFVEICVARKDTDFKPSIAKLETPVPWENKPHRTLICTETFARSSFVPHYIGKSCFENSWSDNAYIHGYLTKCFITNTGVLAVTKVDVFGYRSLDEKLLKRVRERNTHMGGSNVPIDNCVLCRVLTPKEVENVDGFRSPEPYGGLFVKAGWQYQEAPLSFAFFDKKDKYDTHIFRAKDLFPGGFPLTWYLGLQATFTKHKYFKQSDDANVVKQDINFSEFLKLRLFYPMAFNDACHRADVQGDHEITITGVLIILRKIDGTHERGDEDTTKVYDFLVHDRVCQESFKWSEFDGCDMNDPCNVTMDVPKDLIDSKFPSVSPTIYCNLYHRRYKLKIVMDVRVRMGVWEVQRSMKVRLHINIASIHNY